MKTSSRLFSLAFGLLLLAKPILGLSQAVPNKQPVLSWEVRRQIALGRLLRLPMQQPPSHVREAGRPSKPLSTARAQTVCPSLIANGDFEQLNVPTLTYASNVKNPSTNLDELTGWQATNYATPDYYNYNSSSALVYPPTAYLVPFTPHGGQGSIGIYAERTYQEYIYQQIQPLLANKKYYAEFFALESFSVGAQLGMNVTSTNPLTTQPGVVYSAVPTGILSSATQPISQTDWTRVSGVFTAQGGESHVNIGCMAPLPTSGNYNYYIDDVALYEIPTAGPDASVCLGGSVTLGSGCEIPGAQYVWTIGNNPPFASSSSLQTTVTPSTTTTYTLTVMLPDGHSTSSSDVTITVTNSLAQPAIIAGSGSVCYNRTADGRDRTTLTISTPAPAGTYYHGELIYNLTGEVVESAIDSNVGTAFSFFLIGGNYTAGQFTLRVRLMNGPCYGPWRTKAISIVNCTTTCSGRNCPGARVSSTAYPNPATESITLPEGVESATLLNYQGKVVRQQNSSSNRLNVQELPDGLYNLQMRQEGKVINQRIEIKH